MGRIDTYPRMDQPREVEVCTSTTRPPVRLGLFIFETDTLLVRFWDGTVWRVADATRVVGGGPIITAAPTWASTQFRVQGGTFVQGTDASGDLTLTYPTAFPNGVLCIMAQQGDNTHAGATYVPYQGSQALTGCKIRVYNSSGAVWTSSGNMRVMWMAVGW